MKCVRLAMLPAVALLSACADGADRTIVAPSTQLVGEAAPLSAPAVVYGNFGAAPVFDTISSHAWTINGFIGPGIGQQAISQQFTPAGDARLGSVQVALSLFSVPGSVRVVLQADAAGLPGAIIEEFPLSVVGSTPRVYGANSLLSPVLHTGTPYWVTVAAGGDGVLAGWNWNTIGDVTREGFATTQGGGPAGPWGLNPTPSIRGAFAVNGAPLTPRDGVLLLQDRIGFLVAHSLLPAGPAHGLSAKLAATTGSLDLGSNRAACNQLFAFIRQSLALLRTGATATPIGQELIIAAGSIRGELGC